MTLTLMIILYAMGVRQSVSIFVSVARSFKFNFLCFDFFKTHMATPLLFAVTAVSITGSTL
jgi:hypothetical protein